MKKFPRFVLFKDNLVVAGNSSYMNDTEMVESVLMFTPSHLKTSKKVKAPNKKSQSSKRKLGWKGRSGRRTKKKRSSYIDTKCKRKSISNKELDEIELTSQESISLLQGCCESKADFPQLIETCVNSYLETINLSSVKEGESWEVKEYPQNTRYDDDDSTILNASRNSNNSLHSPTDFSIFCDKTLTTTEENGSHYAKFIGCIIKLRCLLSSKTEDSVKRLSIALNDDFIELKNPSSSSSDNEENGTFPGETDEYLAASNDVDGGFQNTITSLLAYFEAALEMDLEQIAFSWKNSIYELGSKMLSESVEYEPKVRKQVDLFLGRIIASISKNETGLKVHKFNFFPIKKL